MRAYDLHATRPATPPFPTSPRRGKGDARLARVKFLHIADAHLSRPFGFLPPFLAEERRRDQRRTFAKAIDLALDRGVDLLLISGDLFDRPDPDPTDLEAVTTHLTRLTSAGKLVFAIPGNHDHCIRNSFWHRLNMPGLHLFLEPQCTHVVLDEIGIAVAGCAFDRSQSDRRAFEGLDLPRDLPCILLMHASLESFEGQLERYHPFGLTELEQCGVTYVALGHYHGLNTLTAGDVTACYPGSFEGLSFDGPETEGRHVVAGEIGENGAVSLEPIKLNLRTMRSAEIDCTSFESPSALDDAVRRLCDPAALVQLRLTGTPVHDLTCSVEELQARFRESCLYITVDASGLSSLQRIHLDHSIRGRFCKHILDQLEDASDPERQRLLRRALDLGLTAFSET